MEANRIELRQYQQDAVKAMAEHNSGICVAPAGSGKTIIAAEIIALCVRDMYGAGNLMPSVLWLAHTQEQVQQGKDACERLAAEGFVNIEFACYAANPVIRHDIVIIDECHWAGAESVRRLVNQAREVALFVYGFTATPRREDGVDITEIIGPILYEVKRSDIEAVGGVLPAEVRVMDVGQTGEFERDAEMIADMLYTSGMRWADGKNGNDDNYKRCVYRAALKLCVRDNPARDRVIDNLTSRHYGESVIVLVDTKEHGRKLESIIEGSKFVASGISSRSRILGDFKSGKIGCLISTAILDEGFDAPIASVLIMAGCGKAFGKIIQRTGRVLRPHGDKQRGIIYDLRDMGHGMIANQFWARKRAYRAAGYTVVSGGGVGCIRALATL
jgi:superfamily II DNA or RNA helicase